MTSIIFIWGQELSDKEVVSAKNLTLKEHHQKLWETLAICDALFE